MAKAKFLCTTSVILLMQGCASCGEKTKMAHIAKPKEQLDNQVKFGLSPQILFAEMNDFSYRSSLQLSLTKADSHVINNELVNVQGSGNRLHMRKKIDGSHFFEIVQEQDLFLVKSRNGDWRSGNSNKAKYKSLISDGLNLLPWLMEEFSLDDIFIKQDNSLEINKRPIPAGAPFVRDLKVPCTQSNMNAKIELDPATGLLSSASIVIACLSTELELKLEATISLAKDTHVSLKWPDLSPNEALNYPVNIASRFKELLNQELNQ